MEMNGAPEGELFDVTVLPDEELVTFAVVGSSELNDIFSEAHSKIQSSKATWGDRYAFVEIIRSIVLHRTDFINQEILDTMVRAANSSVESLRSSEIRNGVLALRNIITKCFNSINSADMSVSFGLLVSKASSGPKFICK